MKRAKITAVVLSLVFLLTVVSANKPHMVYADELDQTVLQETTEEETVVEETEVEETVAEETTEETAEETTEETTEDATVEEEVEEEVVTDEASDATDMGIAIISANFPDGMFRIHVSSRFDTNHDKVLSQEEIDAVTMIDFGGGDTACHDLTGIEYFTNLTFLRCYGNGIKPLVIDLSHNTKLDTLICDGHRLTSLDVSHNPDLTFLSCDNNELQSLDLTNNTRLKYLSCYNNSLTSLDISNCQGIVNAYTTGIRSEYNGFSNYQTELEEFYVDDEVNVVIFGNVPSTEVSNDFLQHLESIDFTVDPEFVRQMFDRNEDFAYYYDGSASQEGYRYSASDIINAVSVIPNVDPGVMLYLNEHVDSDGKVFAIAYRMTDEMLLRIADPDSMDTLNITVNGDRLPLSEYQFVNNPVSDYYRFQSDDLAGCYVVFAQCNMLLCFTEDYIVTNENVDVPVIDEPIVDNPVIDEPIVEEPVVEEPEAVETVNMYRLYNPNSGEHFFTSSAGERDSLVAAGWSNEGIGWKAPVRSNTPVYRLYNQNGGEHHYTTSASERDFLVSNGWSDEGIGWYSDDNHGVPVYRQYNPNSFSNNHNYSTSASENSWLVSIGWKDEGIAWYGVA